MSELADDVMWGIRNRTTGTILPAGGSLQAAMAARESALDPESYELVERYGNVWRAMPPGYENDTKRGGSAL